MPETYCTGLIGLPTVTLHRQRDVMRHPTMQRSSHVLVRPMRGTSVPTPGYVVLDWDGIELGVLVRVEAGRSPVFAVVPVEGRGPTARIAGRHAAAGSLAMHVAQERVRAVRRAERAEDGADAAVARRRVDPFDAEALQRLTPADVRPT